MIKEVWNYLKGYVIIEISGFAVERFLNLCINKNIILQDIKESTLGVICRVNINDFKNLKEIAKKTGCKYKIKSKYGARFFMFQNRKRVVLMGSVILFIFLIQYFSSFIWAINVTGTSIVDNNQILKFCEENNFYLGASKKDLDPKQLQTDIKNNFDNISWISVQIKGTTINIKLSENIDNNINFNNINNKLSANNIISTEDGIIYSISTQSGTPLVKQNDVVKKGDVLVSGELFLKDGEEITGSYTTTSEASIKAITEVNFETEVLFEYYIKKFTGEEVNNYSLKIFNKNLDNIFNKNLDNMLDKELEYKKVTSMTQLKLGESYALPFIIIKDTYLEYTEEKCIYTEDEAIKKANIIITEKIISDIEFAWDIIEKSIEYEVLDNKLIAYTSLKLIKDIGEKVEIDFIEKPIKISEDNINNDIGDNNIKEDIGEDISS